MKKIMIFFAAVLVLMLGSTVMAADYEFNESENNAAITVYENEWTEFDFNSDILLKINSKDKNTISIFEMNSEYGNRLLHYYVFTKGTYSTGKQNITMNMPIYAAIPDFDDRDGYLKIDYESDINEWLRGGKLKVRLRTVSCTNDGWENALKIGLNEEHIISFDSFSDSKWYKLVVPDDKFRYTYNINTSNQGCFIAAIYSEKAIKSGGKPSFCDCVKISQSTLTVDTMMGSGTYYVQIFPIPFYDDILNTEFIFATDNKDSSEVTGTTFGALVSTWAKDEIEKAYKNGLIPEKLSKSDLTKKVTREEFAAIAMELYKELSSKIPGEATNCHFTDISNSNYIKEIKMAYGIGVVEGMSDTQFAPRNNITREQLATILCRVLKRDMEEKSVPFSYVTNYTPFDDDVYISEWAKPSVYFMAANNLVKGVSNNKFAPKNVTEAQEALGYADATKEQAIIIAQRIFSGN